MGGFPPRRQGSGPRGLRGSLPIFLRYAACRTVPSAAAVLDHPPPVFWGFIPVALKKSCGFLSHRDFFISETEGFSRVYRFHFVRPPR